MTVMDMPLARLDPNKLRAKIVQLGEDYADKDAAANHLEESRKSLLAALMLSAAGKSQAEREMHALASEGYREHVKQMVDARRDAVKARVRYDAAKTWVEMVRSIESTKRAEMQIR